MAATEKQHANVFIRVSVEYAVWLGRLAQHVRLNRSDLVDQALARLARELDFDPPPPRS